MTHIEVSILTYLLNAVWQVPLVFLLASLASRIAGSSGPQMQHRIWVVALFLQVLLPGCALSIPLLHRTAISVTLQATLSGAAARTSGHPFAVIFSDTSLFACAVVVLYSLARLLLGLHRTRKIRRNAQLITLSGDQLAAWQHCARVFAVHEAQLAISPEVSGPSTVGIRGRVVLFPPALLENVSHQDLNAALAHEFAHMRRRDYGTNLIYELVMLPLAWHPLMRLTRLRIAESREMVCDELASRASAGPHLYAHSLLRLAALSTPAGGAAAHAIGILDANILERRVMTLTRQHSVSAVSRRAVTLAAVLLGIATCASAMSLRLRLPAQALAADAIQQPPGPAKGSTDQDNGNVYHVGGSVRPPVVIYTANPEYPEHARKAKQSGTVIVSLMVDAAGDPHNVHVARGLGNELDQKAVEAVQQYRFNPATRNGAPVAVYLNVAINFQIF